VTSQRAQTRERAASAAQYILLGGFAAVAAGISAQGLTGFARTNMELTGPWPYLLFLALDGAAGVCAVLLVRRAARAESARRSRRSTTLPIFARPASSSRSTTTLQAARPPSALPQIASALPADAAFQITRTAERLGFTDYSDVLAEVANAVIRKTGSPKGNSCNAAPVLVKASFPRPPPAAHVGAEPPAARMSRTNSHPKPPRSKYLPSSRVVVPNFDYIA
jgi:hypothetical protein